MGQSRKNPNRLRKHRRLAGHKQCEVAKILGIRCTNRLSRWEKGLSIPSLRNAIKLSVLYNTLVEELFFDVLKESRSELNQFKSKKP